MDATPSFGVSMISEVPSNPQLTLVSVEYQNGLLDTFLRQCASTNKVKNVMWPYKIKKCEKKARHQPNSGLLDQINARYF